MKSFNDYIISKVVVLTPTKQTRKKSFNDYISEKNVPNDPKKWSAAKAAAKAKFDVYPSAYANAWASKKYKSMGGTWRKA